MRTLILHLGMNNAGSSSIQASLRNYDDGRIRYARIGAPNHSKAISTLVMAHPENLNAYRVQEFDTERIEQEKKRFTNRLTRELSLDRETFIVSGEGIAELDRADVEQLKALVQANDLNAWLIAYIREPVGYASSALSQSVKSGGREFSVTPPDYRRKFEKFIDVFGQIAVEFVAYSPETLLDGSASADFAVRVGADRARFTEEGDEELQLAPEAVALLHFWNRESRSGIGAKAAIDARRNVVRILAGAFPGRFRLGPKAIASAIDPADVAWMENTAGFSLETPPAEAADEPLVESEDDLAALRADSRTSLASVLDRHGVKAPAGDDTSALLDRLLQALMAGETRPHPAAAIARSAARPAAASAAAEPPEQARPAGQPGAGGPAGHPVGAGAAGGQAARQAAPGRPGGPGGQPKPGGPGGQPGRRAMAGRPGGAAGRQAHTAEPAGPGGQQPRPGGPAGPAGKQGKAGGPGGPAGQRARPGGPERPAGQRARPGGPEGPAGQQAKPGGSESPAGHQAMPGGPERRAGQQARPGGPERRAGQRARPGGPERPAGRQAGPGGADRPAGQPARAGGPARRVGAGEAGETAAPADAPEKGQRGKPGGPGAAARPEAPAQPKSLAEEVARAIWRVDRKAGDESRFVDGRDERIADAEAIIKELTDAGIRFNRS